MKTLKKLGAKEIKGLKAVKGGEDNNGGQSHWLSRSFNPKKVTRLALEA